MDQNTTTAVDSVEEVVLEGRFYQRKYIDRGSSYCVDVILSNDINNIPLPVQRKTKTKRGFNPTVTGYDLPKDAGIKVRYHGKWEDSKYGMQFSCQFAERVLEDESTIVKFLSSKSFKGIGPVTAEKIVRFFKKKDGTNDILQILAEKPEALLKVRGVSIKQMEIIKRGFNNNKSYIALATALSKYGLSADKLHQTLAVFGDKAAETVTSNPFELLKVEGIGFATADRVAKGMNVMLTSQVRIAGAVNSVLALDSATNGNIWMEFKELLKNTHKMLNQGFETEMVSPEQIVQAVKVMVEKKEVAVKDGHMVYSKANWQAEYDTCQGIVRLLKSPVSDKENQAFQKAYEDFMANASFPYGNDQKKAIQTAINNRVCIITGGPGTGKSTIMLAIVQIYKAAMKLLETSRANNITLMAPTGKAAGRLAETTNLPAGTIHNTIGMYDYHGGTKEIPEGLIIVDEFSMVDQYVARAMFNQIKSDNCRLVMVGDADQLPSVQAGNVLEDMLVSNVVPSTRLLETHRQADGSQAIVDNAYRVNNGDIRLDYSQSCFRGVRANSEQEGLDRILEEYRKAVRKYGEDNVVILCPRRKRKPGLLVTADDLNSSLQDVVNKKTSGDISVVIRNTEFRVNDKIIQTKNTRLASNGDIGLIKNITVDSESDDVLFSIEFDKGRMVEYTREDMVNVELAYALTIHKSQGSEYQCVIMPFLDDQRCPLFTRRILYTGLTRAKAEAIVIGSSKAITYCVKNNAATVRQTTLSQRLQANLQAC